MSFFDDWNAMYEKVHDVKETLRCTPSRATKR